MYLFCLEKPLSLPNISTKVSLFAFDRITQKSEFSGFELQDCELLKSKFNEITLLLERSKRKKIESCNPDILIHYIEILSIFDDYEKAIKCSEEPGKKLNIKKLVNIKYFNIIF